MKFIKQLIFLVTLSVPFVMFSQEIIDNAQYRAVYDFSYKTHPEQTEFAKHDLMYLDIGQKATKFYSRFEEIRDSIKNDALEKNLSPLEVNEARKGYAKGTTTIYVQNFHKNQARTINTYFSYGFMYDEPITTIKWQIDDNENVEISGFQCKKAKAVCFGRKWMVYFTPEIPINNGPFKLWGLPGLIIKAWDKDNYFTYELKGFKQLTATNPIILRKSNYSGKLYSLLNKKQYIESLVSTKKN